MNAGVKDLVYGFAGEPCTKGGWDVVVVPIRTGSTWLHFPARGFTGDAVAKDLL